MDIKHTEIAAWLAGTRQHAEGYALFCKYSRNRNLIRFLAVPTARALKMLPIELARLIGVPDGNRAAILPGGEEATAEQLRLAAQSRNAIAQQQKAAANDPLAKYAGITKPRPTDNEQQAYLRQLLSAIFKERGALHGQLETIENEEERREAALKVVEITQAIDEVVAELDLFAASGKFSDDFNEHFKRVKAEETTGIVFPESLPKGLDLKDKLAVQKRLNTVNTYVSRAKTPEAKDKWETEKFFLEDVLADVVKL
jgi:hypothetical protein